MPLSRGVARFNRRVTNRINRHFVRWFPGFAMLFHTGRRSGREYQTPINAFRGGDGYRIALTYGAESDWVRNVLVAGGCTIETRRRQIALTHPHIISDPDRRWAPPVVRQVLGMIGATEYMQLTSAEKGARDE